MTTLDFIADVMVEIGATSAGELPSPDETATGLNRLNGLLDSWNAERLNIFEIQDTVYPLTTAGSYNIGRGIGADFAADRPQKIENANIITSDGVNWDLTIYDADKWAGIVYPNVVGMIPQVIYCDYAYPNATIHLWQPPVVGMSLEIFVWSQLQQIPTLDTPISLPPGYREAVFYNLALRLMSMGDPQQTARIAALASETKANIQRINLPAINNVFDPAITGDCQNSFINITTGGMR